MMRRSVYATEYELNLKSLLYINVIYLKSVNQKRIGISPINSNSYKMILHSVKRILVLETICKRGQNISRKYH
jgi:hypothetical protein